MNADKQLPKMPKLPKIAERDRRSLQKGER
jgi:hypothetical protein